MNPPNDGEPPELTIFKRRLLFQGLLVTAVATPPAIYILGPAGSFFAFGFLVSGLLIYLVNPLKGKSLIFRLGAYAIFLILAIQSGKWFLIMGLGGLLLPWVLLMIQPLLERRAEGR